MPDVEPQDLCQCRCHDEVDGSLPGHLARVRIHVMVRLDDPLEMALACTHCYVWHHRAHQRRRAA